MLWNGARLLDDTNVSLPVVYGFLSSSKFQFVLQSHEFMITGFRV